MTLDLFAGIPVTDYQRALDWYRVLLGSEPAFFPNDVEAVWEVAEHCYLYIVVSPDRAGRAVHLMFVGDLDDRVVSIAERGITEDWRETLDNGVRKIVFHDPDGNETAFGGQAAV
jgi:catechol 2,3-dioxygenase-like lactoylglutathione lyase family enzyme